METKQQIVDEYNKIEATAYAKYQKIEAPALDKYNKIQAPAYAKYNKIQASAWAEKNRKLEELDREIITVEGKKYQLIK